MTMKTNEELYMDFMSRFDALNPPHMRDAFVAGMEAARPQWHDLRKDPNDLPKFCGYDKSDYMIVATDTICHSYHDYSVAFYDFVVKAWYRLHNLEYLKNVIAWSEMPEWKGGEE